MQQLIKNIEQWANNRNLIEGSTPQKQFFKLFDEFGELIAGHNKNNTELIKDSIGDCVVLLSIIQKQFKLKNGSFIYEIESSEILNRQNKEIHLLYITKLLGVLGDLFMSNEVIPNLFARYLDEIWIGLIRYSILSELDFKDCVQHAYDQVKDRKGKMVDGVFVKEEDL